MSDLASDESASVERVSSTRKRLAIVGGGSSGLISLKYARDRLPDWDIVCYERSDKIIGCWGNPYPGFVSTSTKYTTQFSCFPIYDASVQPDGGSSRSEFFCNDEYGRYLERFAEEFSLRKHIQLNTIVQSVRRTPDDAGWELEIAPVDNPAATETNRFDAVILCTGLAAEPKKVMSGVPALPIAELTRPEGVGHIRDKTIVVIGGGESAVDYANRLAKPELGNRVFLSLRTGIRVSPRYHPIRGVPSDFLRNRLMLSIHPDLRNWIGQRFVESRIKYQETFQKLFPSRNKTASLEKTSATDSAAGSAVGSASQSAKQRQKEWAYKLTKAAKDDLFNMFHNKSDDFLQAVGEERITIIGPPVDETGKRYRPFDSSEDQEALTIAADYIVPAIGFRARLAEISNNQIGVPDFYLGCCHVTYPDLFIVGYARPIIGNIPSISEMQARYVSGLLAGEFERPADIVKQHEAATLLRRKRFAELNLDAMYPVEMFPYCDLLASLMQDRLTRRSWRAKLSPATTLQYDFFADEPAQSAPVYMPTTLILFLLGLKPIDWLYRLARGKKTSDFV